MGLSASCWCLFPEYSPESAYSLQDSAPVIPAFSEPEADRRKAVQKFEPTLGNSITQRGPSHNNK